MAAGFDEYGVASVEQCHHQGIDILLQQRLASRELHRLDIRTS